MTLLLITHEPRLAARCDRICAWMTGAYSRGRRGAPRAAQRARERPGARLRLARRELRGGLKGCVVFLACLVLGVAAIAGVGVINAGVLEGLERDARRCSAATSRSRSATCR